MKTILTLLACLILASQAAADPWTSDDTDREAAFLAAHLVNWGQQRFMAQHDASFPFDERSNRDVNFQFLATGMAQVLIAYALPEKWRGNFQLFTIGVEVGQVSRNFSIGADFRF